MLTNKQITLSLKARPEFVAESLKKGKIVQFDAFIWSVVEEPVLIAKWENGCLTARYEVKLEMIDEFVSLDLLVDSSDPRFSETVAGL